MSAAPQTHLTDLVRRAGSGEEWALRDLRQETRTFLSYSIRKIVRDPRDEEEVLQDVYTYVWMHGAEYRSDRGTPATWLCMLARSRALDRFRRTRWDRHSTEFDDQVRPLIPCESSPEPTEVWQYTMVRTALRELSASEQELLRLAYFEGFSHSEIAAKTGLPLGTVKTKIRVALIRLREKMDGEEKLPRAA